LTIPECSCRRCLTEQIERFMPEGLRVDAGAKPGAEVRVTHARTRRRRAA
jgi:hypothetical protein